MLNRTAFRVAAALALSLPLGLSLGGSSARASKLTDVIDSFDRSPDQGLDFTFSVGWAYGQRDGKVRREFRCLTRDDAVHAFCADASQIIDINELQSTRTWQQLNLDMQLGFWRWAEVHMKLPIILSDKTDLSFDTGVDTTNTTVDPSNRPSLFSVPLDGTDRGGVGDLLFGFRFTPLSTARDFTRPTWAIGVDVVFPTAAVMTADNDKPGWGLWKVKVASSVSSRFAPWVEPYFSLDGTFNIPGSKSLFTEYGRTQTLTSPGHQLGIKLGTEFIPYEDKELQQSFIFDLGGSIDYHFEGREYTELFQALGQSTCDPRDTQNPCDLTTFTRGDIDPATGQRLKTNGLTDVEQYALLKAWFGFRWQMYRYVQFSAQGWLGHETTHFITTADAGKDLDGRNQVEAVNSKGDNEYNPVYNAAYDALGTRFRTGDVMLYGIQLSLTGKF